MITKVSEADVMRSVIKVSIAALLAGLLVPLGLYYIVSATITGANPAVTVVFTIVLPVLIILGLALDFMPKQIKSRIGL